MLKNKECVGPIQHRSGKIRVVVGNKRVVNYLLATLISLKSSSDVVLRGRGRNISKAVHVANIIRQLELADIVETNTGLERVEDGGRSRFVSTIEIAMKSRLSAGPAHMPLLVSDKLRKLKLGEIKRLRSMGLRRGIYHKILPFEDRLLISWAIKAIDSEVKSMVLARLLCEAFIKLAKALMNKFLGIFRHVIGFGVRRLVARTRSLGNAIGLALAWGCDYAMRWARDLSFLKEALGLGELKQIYITGLKP